MIDPRRYDDIERLAMTRVGQWRAINAFRPNFFQDQGFPVRITELGEIRYLLSALHDVPDAERNLREMRGLRTSEIATLCDAIRRFIRFHTVHANRSTIQIPFTGFLYYYALLKKLLGFPEHAAVLDVGPGLGYLPFLLDDRAGFATYNQIEVTQSLYVLQSAINSFVFMEGFRDLAMEEAGSGPCLPAGGLPRSTRAANTIDIAFDTPAACTLFPWWRLHEAFERQYDVILCSENVCEMGETAFAYFCRKALGSLRPNGVLFFHGLGKTIGNRLELIRERLDMAAACGFRSLLSADSFGNNGRLARPNFVLVGPQHERYGDAVERINLLHFDTDQPMIRAVYGLDEPDGEITDVAALGAALSAALTRQLAGGRQAR